MYDNNMEKAKKVCFKCGEKKLLSCFYKHPGMADGRLNKCKECAKRDTREDYRKDRETHLAYEAKRNKSPLRRKLMTEYARNARSKNPEIYKARTAVGNAVRDGRLVRQPCEVCGDISAQAHHRDYSKPLEVEWLCFKCHREIKHDQIVGST